MNTKVVIAGGGFHAIYAAWRLIQEGTDVTLLNSSAQLGGTMRSRPWQDYWLDQGCHNLDLRTDQALQFYTDILGEDLGIIDNHTWASMIQNTWTPGLSWPDFSVDAPQTAAIALQEMAVIKKISENSHNDTDVSITKRNSSEQSFSESYTNRYGKHLTATVDPMIRKLTDGDPASFCNSAINALSMFSRPQLGNDQTMMALKSSADFWDCRLGVSTRCADPRFMGTNVRSRFGYPVSGGLSHFCDRAESRLSCMGVKVVNNATVSDLNITTNDVNVVTDKSIHRADRLLWTLPDHLLQQIIGHTPESRQFLHPVGFSIHAFEVPCDSILGPDYLADFSDRTLAFRYSSPGRYSHQITNDNYTFVMAEIPTHPKNSVARLDDLTRDRIWQDFKCSAYLDANTAYRAATAWSIPVGFTVPQLGWNAANSQYQIRLENEYPAIINIPPDARSRSAFINFYDSQMHESLQ